mmetsp:Transcript_8523/g.12572  ORF Transcript_8523/g.12572 Transcript_8523/m.12572 type:complete len:170 (-) Transcript_8523:40-549(-)
MSTAQGPYIKCIRDTILAALSIQNHASQIVDRHNKPEVEIGKSKELVLSKLTIRRDEHEACLVEPSVNSVRISITFRKNGEIEQIIADRYMNFIMQRAEKLNILRRKPVPGWDISFLITNYHIESMHREKLLDFICDFIKDIDKDINHMKLDQNQRARQIDFNYLKLFT